MLVAFRGPYKNCKMSLQMPSWLKAFIPARRGIRPHKNWTLLPWTMQKKTKIIVPFCSSSVVLRAGSGLDDHPPNSPTSPRLGGTVGDSVTCLTQSHPLAALKGSIRAAVFICSNGRGGSVVVKCSRMLPPSNAERHRPRPTEAERRRATPSDTGRATPSGAEWRRVAPSGAEWRRVAPSGAEWRRVAPSAEQRRAPSEE